MGRLISAFLILTFTGSLLFAGDALAKCGSNGCDTWEEQVKVWEKDL